MGKLASDETIVALAVRESKSVRTTIPKHIATKLGLVQGVHLKWDIDKIEGRWVAVIQKAGGEPEE